MFMYVSVAEDHLVDKIRVRSPVHEKSHHITVTESSCPMHWGVPITDEDGKVLNGQSTIIVNMRVNDGTRVSVLYVYMSRITLLARLGSAPN